MPGFSALSPVAWTTWQEGRKTLYLRPEALLGKHLGDALPKGVGVAWLGLDANLDGLHGSQSDVRKELGAGRCRQVERCPPEVGIFLSQHTGEHRVTHMHAPPSPKHCAQPCYANSATCGWHDS